MNPRRVLLIVTLLALFMDFDCPQALSQPPKRAGNKSEKKTAKNDQKEQEQLETQLLTLPANGDDELAWLNIWRQHLQIGFLRHGVTVHALSIFNKTPCRIEVIREQSMKELLVDGRRGLKQEWIAPPRKKLLLATGPKVPVVVIQNDAGAGVVDAVTTGAVCRLKIIPQATAAEAIELSVLSRIGTLGNQVVFSQYYLCRPGDEEQAIGAIRSRSR